MIAGLVCALGSAAVFGVAAVAQAYAVRALPASSGLRRFVRAAVGSWPLLGVVAAYLLGFALHAVALWLLPLYLAQASLAASFPITAIVSARALGERLGARGWLAVAAVAAGLALLASSAGAVDHAASPRTLAAVGAVWLIVLVAGAPLVRRAGAGTLGAWSGVGYAGSAVTTRGLGPADLPAAAAALAVVAALGLVAFWLYSVALARTDVAASTAPLIVVQTCVPALLGVWWLGDTVRDGGWPALAAGMALALAGAVHLARDRDVAVPRPLPGPVV